MGIGMGLQHAYFTPLGILAWLFGSLGCAHAQISTDIGLWVVDGLHQEQITALETSDEHIGTRWLRLYRLTDPAPLGLECCLLPKPPAMQKVGEREVDSGFPLLAVRGTDAQPFVGIALADGDAVVRRTGPQTLQVLLNRKTPAIRVRHCVTQEGMRIDVEQGLKKKTFYVPLGTEVDVPTKYRCALQQ